MGPLAGQTRRKPREEPVQTSPQGVTAMAVTPPVLKASQWFRRTAEWPWLMPYTDTRPSA